MVLMDYGMLALESVIDRSPTIVSPELSLVDALWKMQGGDHPSVQADPTDHLTCLSRNQQSSYVLVVKHDKLLGIVTEHDIVRLSASGGNLAKLQVREVMTQHLQTLTFAPELQITQVLTYFQQARLRHLPVVDQQGLLLGIVTLEEIRRSLEPVNFLRQRRVDEVMTQSVIWISPTATLLAATAQMVQHQISSLVIAVQDHDRIVPQGILTERDIVRLQLQAVNFETTIVADVMNAPVIQVSPSSSLQAAEQLMQQHSIRRVVVTDECQSLLGILTHTNLVQLWDPIELVSIIHHLKQQIQVLQKVMVQHNQDLEVTNHKLRTEIEKRERVEHNLRNVHQILSNQFSQRTQELLETNQKLHQEVLERKHAESQLKAANLELQYRLGELAQRNQEIALLGQLGHYLHACQNLAEAYAFLPKILASMFPQLSGRLYLFNDLGHGCNGGSQHDLRTQSPPEYAAQARDLTSNIIAWGSPAPPLCSTHSLEACWAIRRGKSHRGEQGQVDRGCQHCMIVEDWSYRLCVPMLTQGQSIGLLILGSDWMISEATHQLAVTVAEHVALALANLKLREDLHYQSVRDPLTGLFNRRYLQTTLDREVQQALCYRQIFSLIMLDIDYFKRLNDTLGHEAGDRVLQQLGQLLLSNSRSTDVICRYGGEEITLILPNTDLQSAYRRAEKLRQQIRQFMFFPANIADDTLSHDASTQAAAQQQIVTVSLGISSFPLHGQTVDELLRAADNALYQAKRLGRDRVEVAACLSASQGEPLLPSMLIPKIL
ncbi:diguanylate cyclase [Alkalinema pantanalense CENA528]|uniref:diguanylate cyclase n=1 Tax=Alkalinema pantanalense TaxID=1620705 RepID=UPI003D6E5522